MKSSISTSMLFTIFNKQIKFHLLLMGLFICPVFMIAQTTLTYPQQTGNYYSTYTTGTAGSYNSNAYQIGMYANGGGTKQVVMWRKFRTDASGTNTSDRSMQIGDQLVVTLSATRAYGRIGFALLASPSTGSYANRESNYAVSFNLDGPSYGGWGNWYAKYNGGTTSSGSANIAGIQGTYQNFTFTITLTAADRMNATWTNGTTTSNLYDIQLNTSNPITDYSIYLEDDYDGGGNNNAYWGLGASNTQHTLTNTGALNIGQSNASFTEANIITNGLNANSASTNSLNNALAKNGNGTLTLTAANTYAGGTTITGGTLKLNPSANVSTASGMILNGGTLSTASIASGISYTSSSTLNLAANSAITLGVNAHTISFTNSSGVTWNGTTLTINGWTGSAAASGTGGKIFIGSSVAGLTSGQLSKVDFTGYAGAILLGTGELVPASSSAANITSFSASPNSGTATTGYAGSVVTVSGAGFTGATTVKYGGSGGTSVGSFTVVNDNTITFTATAATSGALYVSGPAGAATSSAPFDNAGYITKTDGNYTVNSTWLGNANPPAGTDVTIAHNVYVVSTPATSSSLRISPAGQLSFSGLTVTTTDFINDGTLTMGSASILSISAGGSITNNSGATFTGGTGTVIFAGAGTINGTEAITFNNLTLNGNTVLSTVPTINGTLMFNAFSAAVNVAPNYGSSSLLKYNTNGTIQRGNEWSAASGAGYPSNVQLSNNTTIDPGGNTFTATAMNTAGNLTIDAGSAIYMDYGGHNMTVPLTIEGNFNLAGNFSGSSTGGNVVLKGNMSNNGTSANYFPNNSAITFNGTSNQSIGGSNTSTPAFYNLIVNNAAGVTLARSQSVSNNLTLTNGTITLGTYNLTMSSGTITGGSANAYVKAAGTGRLIQTVGGSAKFFPVGKSAFNPITLTNTGTSDAYGVYVVDAVTSPAPNNSSKLVNRYWNINEGTAGGSNLAITVQWNSPAEENANFAAGIISKIGLYSGSWSEQAATQATGTVAGSQSLTSNTNFTPSNITAGATAGAGVDNGFSQALPTISGFTPTSGYVTTAVVITGTNLGTVTSVSFGGVAAASFTINSATQITAVVGSGATGSVSVTNPSGTASMAGFVYNGYVTVQNGSYSTGSTWITGVVPPAGAVVTIAHAITLSSSVNAATSLTINTGASLDLNNSASAITATTVTNNGTLSWSAAGSLSISTNGSLINNGTFTKGTGKVIFNGTGTSTVSGTINFNDVALQKGVDFGSASTVSGNLEMNSGAYIFNNAPVYATGSALVYNTGGSYGRYTEWSATSGKGYPYQVSVQGGTVLDVKNGSSSAAVCAGNLIVGSGSQLTLSTMPTSLTVNGSIMNTGTITLSTLPGGDLFLYGNLTDNGTFNANNRAVFFSGSNTQSISGNSIFDIAYVRINKAGGSVKMLTNLLVEGPGGGNAMEIQGTSSILDLNGHQLTLGKTGVGSTYNSGIATQGFIKGSATSSVIINGTGALGTLKFDQTTDGVTNVLKDMTINRTGGTATLGNKLVIINVFTPAGGTLVTGGFLVLRSNVSSTAQVAAGSSAGGYTSGDVTVERYMPYYGHRAWMMLAVPTGGSQTINAAWQEGQAAMGNGNPGYGTLLTKASANPATGYDATTTGNSLLTLTTGNPGTWTGVTANTTGTPIATTSGYMVYMRGDRSSVITGGPAAQGPTTLRTSGSLYQGTQTAVPVSGSNNILVGNIYASAVDFENLVKTGLAGNFKLWDPKLGTIGGYQTFTDLGAGNPASYTPSPGGGSYGSTPNTRIESGQAFIVQGGGGGGSIQFTEAAKVSGSNNYVFRGQGSSSQYPGFKVNLEVSTASGFVLADGNSVYYNDAYSDAVNNDDATKVSNFGENFGILKDGHVSQVETRRTMDSIVYQMTNLQQQQYRLQFIAAGFETGAVSATLVDNFLHTATPVSLRDTVSILFKVTTDAGSSEADRFKVVFKNSHPVTDMSIHAAGKETTVQVVWTVNNEHNTRSYEVEHSSNGIEFKTGGMVNAIANGSPVLTYNWLDEKPVNGDNYYRVKAVSKSGESNYSSMVKVTIGKDKKGFAVYPNPVTGDRANIQFINQPAGRYTVNVINKAGQVLYSTVILHNGGTATQTVALSTAVTTGTYQVEVVNAAGEKNVQNMLISK